MMILISPNNSINNTKKYLEKIEKEYIKNADNLENIYNFVEKNIEEKIKKHKFGKYIKTSKFAIGFIFNNDMYEHWYFLIELLFQNKEVPIFVL